MTALALAQALHDEGPQEARRAVLLVLFLRREVICYILYNNM